MAECHPISIYGITDLLQWPLEKRTENFRKLSLLPIYEFFSYNWNLIIINCKNNIAVIIALIYFF